MKRPFSTRGAIRINIETTDINKQANDSLDHPPHGGLAADSVAVCAFVKRIIQYAEQLLVDDPIDNDEAKRIDAMIERWLLDQRTTLLQQPQAGRETLWLAHHARLCIRLRVYDTAQWQRWHRQEAAFWIDGLPAEHAAHLVVSTQPMARYTQRDVMAALVRLADRWPHLPMPRTLDEHRAVTRYVDALEGRIAQLMVRTDEPRAMYNVRGLFETRNDGRAIVVSEVMREQCERVLWYVRRDLHVAAWLLGRIAAGPHGADDNALPAEVRERVVDELRRCCEQDCPFMTSLFDEFGQHAINGHVRLGELEMMHVNNMTQDRVTPINAMLRFRPQQFSMLQEHISQIDIRRDLLETPPTTDDRRINFEQFAMLALHRLTQFEGNGASLLGAVVDVGHLRPSGVDGERLDFEPAAHLVPHAVASGAVPHLVAVQRTMVVCSSRARGVVRPCEGGIVDAWAWWLWEVCHDDALRGALPDHDGSDVRGLFRRVWGREPPLAWRSEEAAVEAHREEMRAMAERVQDAVIF